MKLTFLIFIVVLGLLLPAFWVLGTLSSIVYFCLRKVGLIRKEQAAFLNPQLGLTMADGGDSIDKAKKK